MQAYHVEFTAGRLSPLQITDGVPAEIHPAPHLPVGDPTTPGQGIRVPLTTRLCAGLDPGAPRIERTKPFRDPKTGAVVLGVEPPEEAADSRALVLLSASSGFPEEVVVNPQKGLACLARGQVGPVRHLLLIWPDGGAVTVEDPVQEERYELTRSGDQFRRSTQG